MRRLANGGTYDSKDDEVVINGGTIQNNTATKNGGGIQKRGKLTISGKLIVSDNKKGTAKNDILIPTDATQKYINIAAAGLSCGTSIGVYSATTYSSSIQIATGNGTAPAPANNCLYAYRNKFFFDDQAASQVFNTNASPYYDNTTGTNLYFVKNAQANTGLDSWHNQAATAGTDYVLTSGFVSEVKTAAGMAYFSKDVLTKDYSGKTVKLSADINLSGNNWEPIGYMNDCSGIAFKGTFDGQWHTISGVTCPYQYYNIGLFGCVDGGTIKNTFVVSGTLNNNTAVADCVGGLVGWMKSGTISNCEAAVTMKGANGTIVGGLVGQMTAGTIQSCSAMPTASGYQMGGLVGQVDGGSVLNSFANPSFTRTDGSLYIGGIAGVSKGTVKNCYVRQRGTAQTGNFGWIVGNNTGGTVSYCYIPNGQTVYVKTGSAETNSGAYTNPVAPYLYTRTNDNTVSGTALLALLNQQRGSGAEWKRTTAGGYTTNNGATTGGNINGDFPVHKYANTKCVASTNGIVLDYHTSLDNMLTRHTSNTTVNLYAHDNTSKGTGSGVTVYIDENISLLQSTSNAITAYTCQVLPGSPRGWHFLSSSLSDSGIGFIYGTTSQVPFSWAENPCNVTISNNNDQSLYPSDLPNINKVDLYCFYEPEYHWINLKRNSNSHWHMNATTVPITYTNETQLVKGKGYLVSIDQDQLLQNKGTLNNGDVSITLHYTPHNEWAGLLGYNLLGNPYQSYFDFREFADQNSSLWYDQSKGHVEPTYAVYDPAMGGYIQYKEGSSRGSKSASGVLNMHQGFMIRVVNSTTPVAHFTNGMRTNNGSGVTFREEPPAYPLINLTVTDDEGVNDFAVLELGRDNDEGAEKLRANDSKGWLYLHHGNENYGILFRSEVEDYQPLWFEADEAGAYTLSWETANAEFESLTLVDNITGRVTDMLATGSYAFEADPSQYESRFKIVIGDWKDVEEHEAPEPVEGPTFAYQMGDEIIVNGEGRLEVVDMLGRVVVSRDASQSPGLSTAGMTPGVYVLRLNDGKGTRIQKIIIK